MGASQGSVVQAEGAIAISAPSVLSDASGTTEDSGTDKTRTQVQSEHKSRVLGFDMIRAFAAVLVLFGHSVRAEWSLSHRFFEIAGIGTAFLNLLAGYFLVQSFAGARQRGQSVLTFSIGRARRLYGAFAIWLAIYLAYLFLVSKLFHRDVVPPLRWSMLLEGINHLWFLPYLLIVSVIAAWILKYVLPSPVRTTAAAGIIGTLAVGLIVVQYQQDLWIANTELGWLRIFCRTPGFMIGVSLGLWLVNGRKLKSGLSLGVAAGVMFVFFVYLRMTSDIPTLWLNRLAALSCFILALCPWSGLVPRMIAKCGQLGFGVYLCHGVVGAIIYGILQHVLHIRISVTADMIAFVLTLVGSFGVAWMIRCVPQLGWMIPS